MIRYAVFIISQMIKKTNDISQLQQMRELKERQALEKAERIRLVSQEIQRSKRRQAELIRLIQLERQVIEEKQNTLASANNHSLVDIDIRNSQLISCVQLERKRWLESDQKQNVEIMGEDEHVKTKHQELKAQEKPTQKAKMLKLMKRKQELLQNLAKVKPETGLAVSHQRVFLKQYLEDIRVLNAELEESNKKYSNLELEYSRAATKLKNTVSDLKVASAANFKALQ